MSSRKAIFLVDDEAPLRKALGRLLTAEGFQVTPFTSAEEFLRAKPLIGGACVLLDIAMPGIDGLELQRQLADAVPPPAIVFLTGHGDIPMSVQAIKAGAVDFLTKPVDDTDLLRAVRAALAKAAVQQATAAQLAEWRTRLEALTPREHEVLTYVVSGRLNKQIASDLGVVEHTIKMHRGRVMEKMKVDSVAELVRIASRLGVTPAP